MEKLAASDWKERLKNSEIDQNAVRNIIELETDALELYEELLDPVVNGLLDEYERKNHLKIDDLTRAFQEYFGDFANEVSGIIKLYYRGLVNTSRENAYKNLGFEREARTKLVRKAAIERDTAYEDSIDKAFTKVKTVNKDVIDSLKQDWIDQGGPTDVVRNFLLDEEEQLSGKDLSREELKEKIKQLWREKRFILERIIRTESVNTYARVQLQEWYDQGVREVERVEMNDLKTCDLCREISSPGRNVFLIEDLLKQEYPVTFLSHPNCRGSYRPRINWSVFEEFERKINEFQNSQDIETTEGRAENVPLEYQQQVEKAIEDFGPDYGIKFVPDITESEEWQEDRLNELKEFYDDRQAMSRLELEKAENRGRIVNYTTRDGKVLVSGNAGDINRIVVPILREKAQQVWLMADNSDKEWVKERFKTKTKETGYTLEDQGIEIIGSSPFISSLAEQNAEQYFIESYTNYVADPTRLIYMDEPMYEFLREKFMSNEYLLRGGIK